MTSLQGDMVRLWLYARGVYPADLLHKLWSAMAAENGARRIFATQECHTEKERGDLESVCLFFSNKILYLVEQEGHVCGAIWFDHIDHGTAHINIWMSKQTFGAPAREALHLAIAHSKESFQWDRLWAYTPWKSARKIAQDVGFVDIATLPGRVWMTTKQQWHPLYILRKDLGKE